jgi:hypothetical protein
LKVDPETPATVGRGRRQHPAKLGDDGDHLIAAEIIPRHRCDVGNASLVGIGLGEQGEQVEGDIEAPGAPTSRRRRREEEY